MNGYDETTLPRAVAAYGPYRIEYRVLRRVGELNDKTGELQGYLAQLLDGEPVPMTWVSSQTLPTKFRLCTPVRLLSAEPREKFSMTPSIRTPGRC